MIYFDDLNVFIHPFIPKNMSETLTMCDSKKDKVLGRAEICFQQGKTDNKRIKSKTSAGNMVYQKK